MTFYLDDVTNTLFGNKRTVQAQYYFWRGEVPMSLSMQTENQWASLID